MNDREILDRLWEAHRETPFASLMMQRKLDLRHNELPAVLNLIGDMADSGEVRSGYRIKRVASTMYKLISQAQGDSDSLKGLPQTQGDSDSPKGKPLINENEAVLGQPESDCLSTDAENHTSGQDDPFPAVPAELKALRQWVAWREEQRDGKPTKIPYQVNRRKAQPNNPQTWTDYQTVCDHRDDFSGIGFVFSADDSYCGIDLDDCLDAQGKLKAWAKPIVDRLKSVGYGERSPSGHGIKFWTRAALGTETKHKVYVVEGADAIEIYDQLRYFTVTGKGKWHHRRDENQNRSPSPPGASAIARRGVCNRRTDTSTTGENTKRPVHRPPSRTRKQIATSSSGNRSRYTGPTDGARANLNDDGSHTSPSRRGALR